MSYSNTLDKFLDYPKIIEEKDSQKLKKQTRGEQISPDATLREKIALMQLRRAFIREGYDFIVYDRTDVNEEYDSLVVHQETGFPYKVQVKTCGTIDPKNPNFFIYRFSKGDVINKYPNIDIFILYAGVEVETDLGIEYRNRFYVLTRSELLDKIKKYSPTNDKLRFNFSEKFWIQRCGHVLLFDYLVNLARNMAANINGMWLLPEQLEKISNLNKITNIEMETVVTEFVEYVKHRKNVEKVHG